MGTKKGQKRKTARRAYEKEKRRKARRVPKVLQPPPQIDARQTLKGFGEVRADLQAFHYGEAMKAQAAFAAGGGTAASQAALAQRHQQQLAAAHVFPPPIQNFNAQGNMWGQQQHYQNPALPAPAHVAPAPPPGRAAPLAQQFPAAAAAGPSISYPRVPRPEGVGDVENRRQAAAMAEGQPAGRGLRNRVPARQFSNSPQSNAMNRAGRHSGTGGGSGINAYSSSSAPPIAADRLAGVLSGSRPIDEAPQQNLQGVGGGGGMFSRLKRALRRTPKPPRGGAVGRATTKRTNKR